jgi:hypothetical protein
LAKKSMSRMAGFLLECVFYRIFLPTGNPEEPEMLLALLNGKPKSEKAAINNANHRLFRSWYDKTDPAKREAEQKECKERMARWSKAGLLDKNSPSTEAVLKAFYQAHKPIKDKFSSGCSLELQNIDAEIALWVMVAMMVEGDECIPCLPVHDSFVTFKKYEEVLRSVMAKAYQYVMRRRTGRQVAFKIPIK